MNGFHSYDQWRTASPFDEDEYDDTRCIYCGIDLPDDVTGMTEEQDGAVDEGFCSPVCLATFYGNGGQQSPDWGKFRCKPELLPVIAALREEADELIDFCRSNVKPVTIKDIFEHAPDGDFQWVDHEGCDWHVYACGESDCPVGWHRQFFYTDISRTLGKRTVEIGNGDADGDRQIECYWSEVDDMTEDDFLLDVGREMALQSDEYLHGWALYWLDCAITGDDPVAYSLLNKSKPGDVNWTQFCIDSARDDIKYLKMGADRLKWQNRLWHSILMPLRRIRWSCRHFFSRITHRSES